MPHDAQDQDGAAQGDAPLLPGLAAALPVPVAVILGEGLRVAAANAAWNRLAAGAATLDALFPRAAPVAAAALASGAASLSLRALAGGAAGDATWWDLDLVPHPDRPDALVVTAREVTAEVLARREEEGARAALDAVDARLRLAQDAAGVGTWEWDARTDRLSWSPGQFRLHGMDPARDAPPGFDAWIAMVHPDDRAPLLAAAEGAVDPDGHYQVEFRLRLAGTGEERWLLSRGRVMRRAPDGRPLRILGVNLDVTERRQEAEALREREERLRLAFRAAGLFAWDWDVPAGRVVWSDGAEALLGMEPGGFPGTVDAFRALVHPEDAPAVEAALGRALAGEDPEYAAEFRMRRGDGSWRWTATRAAVLRDAAGHPLRVVGVDHDVTERRAAEDARGEAERRAEGAAWLRLALEAGGMGAWDWDTGDRTGAARWDALMETLTGLRAEGGRGNALAFMDRIHPEDRPAVEEAVAAALAQGPGGTYEAEFRFRRPDGAVRWFRGRGQVAAGGTGGAPRLLGLNWDVSERREAATALEESEARLRALVAAMPQVAFAAPPDGRTDFVNARWTEYSGQDVAAARDGGWAAAVHPDDGARSVAAWETAVRTGEPCTFEQRLRGADGGFRWFLTRAEPLRDGGGRILRWFGTCTDISAIVEAREAAARSAAELERLVAARTRALAEAAAELQAEMRRREAAQEALLQSQKLEALGQLTSGVAHDFNNLLAAIQGSFRLLRREVGEASPRAAALLTHGEGAAERGARLIGQLSAFARREPPQAAVTDPAALLEGVHELLCHTAGALAQCRVAVEPGAWPVLVDPVRLETVLLNLAANARDAMPLGGEITVSARNAREDELPPGLPPGRGFLRLALRDAGTGMDADTLRRATEPFFTTKPRGMGTGLGLSSAHAFCAASDGALRLSSRLGEGTEVELFLPRAAILPGEEAAEAGARHGDATILLAEDDEALRPVTATLLRNLGYAVIEAPSAEAAAALAHAAPALDMLVTDVALGGVPGPVLAARLRAERPGLPVLFVTGHGRAPALDGGAVLPKPFAEADLARMVLRGLGRLPGEGAPPPDGRLLARLRHPALRGALEAWLAARALAAGALPAPDALAGEALPAAARDHMYLAEVQPTPDGAEIGAAGFRFIQAGRALEARFGAALAGRVVGLEEADGAALTDTLGGSLGAAYRRCARTRAPLLDYARFDLGDGLPEQVERLVVPLSADGIWVTHLLGVAVVTEGAPAGRA